MGMLFTDPRWQQMKAPKSNRMAQGAHAKLLRLHGSKAPRTCGECQFLVTVDYFPMKWFKCDKSGVSSRSQASDWRKKWEACGLFTEMQ